MENEIKIECLQIYIDYINEKIEHLDKQCARGLAIVKDDSTNVHGRLGTASATIWLNQSALISLKSTMKNIEELINK